MQELVKSLTRREKQVFYLILDEIKTAEITQKLGITVNTVRTYYKHIYQKMFVGSKKELLQRYKNKRYKNGRQKRKSA